MAVAPASSLKNFAIKDCIQLLSARDELLPYVAS